MGLFGDTLRDARRPLPASGDTVRRSAIDEALPDEPASEPADPGLQTVFRFQKEGPAVSAVGLRKASYQAGGGSHRPTPGDPSSAGTPVEEHGSPANVLSVQGVSRESSLEAGGTEQVSGYEALAVRAEPGSFQRQPHDASGWVESVSSANRTASISSENRAMSSGPDEAVLSRVPGRGAPSEFIPAPAPPAAAAALSPERREAIRQRSQAAQAEWRRMQDPQDAAPAAPRAERRRPWGDPTFGPASAVAGAPRQREARPVAARPTDALDLPRERASAAAPPAQAAPAAPTLRIGRIEVMVQAPPSAPPAAAADPHFASRNYLRRL